MKKDQLVKKMHCAIKHWDIGQSSLSNTNFKLKMYEIQKKPDWPKAIKFFAYANIDSL